MLTPNMYGIFTMLAGEEGFEPPNSGFKVRCLTAWPLPIDEMRVWRKRKSVLEMPYPADGGTTLHG